MGAENNEQLEFMAKQYIMDIAANRGTMEQSYWDHLSQILSNGSEFFPKYVGQEEVQKIAEKQIENIAMHESSFDQKFFSSFFSKTYGPARTRAMGLGMNGTMSR